LKWAKGKNVSTVDIKKIQQLSRLLCLNAFASHCSRCAPALHFRSRCEHSSNTLCENDKNHFLHTSGPATQSSEKNPLVLVLGKNTLVKAPSPQERQMTKIPSTHNVQKDQIQQSLRIKSCILKYKIMHEITPLNKM
jgi:hypothetical protein